MRVTAKLIYDFQSHLSVFFKINPQSGRETIRVRDVRIFEYDSRSVHVKYSMSPFESPLSFTMSKPGSMAVNFPTKPMFDHPLPICPAKLKGLMKLSEKYLPTEYKGGANGIHE